MKNSGLRQFGMFLIAFNLMLFGVFLVVYGKETGMQVTGGMLLGGSLIIALPIILNGWRT